MYIFSSGSCAFCSKQFVSYDSKTPKVQPPTQMFTRCSWRFVTLGQRERAHLRYARLTISKEKIEGL